MNSILVIVHPGSACGSADMNLGPQEAERQRVEMEMSVREWKGGVFIIDGDLSDELDRRVYSDWGRCISEALIKAHDQGFPTARLQGDDNADFDQICAMKHLIQTLHLTPENTQFTLSGAWYESSSGGGCVGSVHDYLVEQGFKSTVDIEAVMDMDIEMEQEPHYPMPRSRF